MGSYKLQSIAGHYTSASTYPIHCLKLWWVSHRLAPHDHSYCWCPLNLTLVCTSFDGSCLEAALGKLTAPAGVLLADAVESFSIVAIADAIALAAAVAAAAAAKVEAATTLTAARAITATLV